MRQTKYRYDPALAMMFQYRLGLLRCAEVERQASFKHFFINADSGKVLEVSNHFDYIRGLKVGKNNTLGLEIKNDPNVSTSPIKTKEAFVKSYPVIIVSWDYPDIGISFSGRMVNPHKCFYLVEKFGLSHNFEREEVTFDNMETGRYATLLWTSWITNSNTENSKFISRISSVRQAADFQDVSDLQFKYRKQLFDLYSKNKDDKTEEYFKELKKLEKEQKHEVQQIAKSIYDEVKGKIGATRKVGSKEVSNKYNFWLYKGNTGMKISVTIDGKKIMTLKCGRDVGHETSGAKEKVLIILGNEDVLNKKKDKEKFLVRYADNADDIIKLYAESLKKVI